MVVGDAFRSATSQNTSKQYIGPRLGAKRVVPDSFYHYEVPE